MPGTIHSVVIKSQEDVAAVRRHSRHIAGAIGFDGPDQTRIAVAVSEIARNAFSYAGGGTAEFLIDPANGMFTIRIEDEGPGVCESKAANGLGIPAARRLMDNFSIESQPGKGTRVRLSKALPEKAPKFTQDQLAAIGESAKTAQTNLLEELKRENRGLLHVMEELRGRQDDLARLNAELEDTNRGVVALHAELDEHADGLRRANHMKSRFLSHMSHEFRTPLTSIMALGRLLTGETDGKLSSEQHKQVNFIRKSAENLLEMVNDLLDLARVEAGKSVVRPSQFQAANLFGGLRGVLRPLQTNENVELIFDDVSGIPPFYTDESKVAQILRNFISNALKFTERGEVRVSARGSDNGKSAVFRVSDTGIGIEGSHLHVIFQEFGQIEMPMQSQFRGAGLGLSLSKGLAELLGGRVRVESEPGRGSSFYAEIPFLYRSSETDDTAARGDADVLLIDDEEVARYLVRQALGPSVSAIEAVDGANGIELARKWRPRAILLDVRMPGMSGFEVLKELKANGATRDIPVVILTAKALTPDEADILKSQASAVLSKELLSQPGGGERLRTAIAGGERGK